MFEELAKQISDTSVKLEAKRGAEVAVPWFERQMGWLGELRDGSEEARGELREGFESASDSGVDITAKEWCKIMHALLPEDYPF